MNLEKRLSILNAVAFIIAFFVSTASQFKIMSNADIGEVSHKYDTSFAPIGLTFSIWGVIYISLFAFCIYHLIKSFTESKEHEANRDLRTIDYLFIINNIAATFWVLAWLNEYIFISVILMIIQCVSLIKISIRLKLYNSHKTILSKVLTQVPLSIYLGWITVASIANTNAFLWHSSWISWTLPESYWTVLLLTAIALISLYVVFIKKNVVFGLVVIWAVYGIVLKAELVDAGLSVDVILAGWIVIALLVVSEVIQIFKNFKNRTIVS